jgi:(E)-4-hydroxy-3-methylbut-2-enyl-diphosphate synthase
MNLLPQSKAPLKFLEVVPFFYNEEVAECLRNNPVAVLVIRSDSRNSLGETRAIIHSLMRQGITNPVIFCKGYDADETREEDVEIESAADTGALLFDRLIDGLCLFDPQAAEPHRMTPAEMLTLQFSILQAARQRVSRTEYISCPGCGRTLYDLRSTIARVKAATSEMKDLKIAVMGCIVNGPGEMADADYGYVGAGPGKISLYRGKECVERNIPEEEAVDHLLALIHSDRG